jgi:hypothetical protein
MMFRWILLLLIVPLVFAESIAPTIYEQKDFGTPSKEEFTYSISVDCTAAAVRAYVMDESIKPVEGADTYLKYIDFAQPLISSVESDKDGFVLHKLPGNVKLMRGLFVLVIQKTDYRSKEIHFDVKRCWSNETVPQPPRPAPSTGNQSPPLITPPPVQNTSLPDANESNITNMSNESGAAETEGEAPELCAGTLALLMIFKFFRGKINS